MYFLSEGVPIDYQHSSSGSTALMIATYLSDKEFITRLYNMGANMEICNEIDKTTLDYERNERDILKLLEYIKLHREKPNLNERDSRAEKLLEFYDKTSKISQNC